MRRPATRSAETLALLPRSVAAKSPAPSSSHAHLPLPWNRQSPTAEFLAEHDRAEHIGIGTADSIGSAHRGSRVTDFRKSERGSPFASCSLMFGTTSATMDRLSCLRSYDVRRRGTRHPGRRVRPNCSDPPNVGTRRARIAAIPSATSALRRCALITGFCLELCFERIAEGRQC